MMMFLLLLALRFHDEVLGFTMVSSPKNILSRSLRTCSFEKKSTYRITLTTMEANVDNDREDSPETSVTTYSDVEEGDQGGFLDTATELVSNGASLLGLETTSTSSDSNDDDSGDQDVKIPKKSFSFLALGEQLSKLLNVRQDEQDSAVSDVISSFQSRIQQGEAEDTTSYTEIFAMLMEYKGLFAKVFQQYLGDIEIEKLNPISFFYYLEREDEIKNPSWKRRMHRFCPGIEMSTVEALHKDLMLCRLSYAHAAETIQTGLKQFSDPYELVYSDLKSEPGKPAHYLAVERNQDTLLNPHLSATIVIRGTKSIADAITDLCCGLVEYRGGQAHQLILESAQTLVETHVPMLLDLADAANKKGVSVKLIGHSMGGGTAAIASMEFNDHPRFTAKAIGFGSPPTVSHNLATSLVDTVTTVVNDADLVPRLSGASLSNILLDLCEFQWFDRAQRDVADLLDQFDFVGNLRDATEELILHRLRVIQENQLQLARNVSRSAVDLYLPGDCIHLYRDGFGYSAVSMEFPSEVDIARTMLRDHLIRNGYEPAFLELSRNLQNDITYEFQDEVETLLDTE